MPQLYYHDLDLDVPLGQEPFAPGVLLVQLAQAFDASAFMLLKRYGKNFS